MPSFKIVVFGGKNSLLSSRPMTYDLPIAHFDSHQVTDADQR